MAAKRRALLELAGLALVPLTLVGRACAGAALKHRSAVPGTARADDRGSLGRRLRDLLDHPEAAHHIAAAWRASGASPVSDPEAALAPLACIDGTEAARAWLGTRIRADFVTGAVLDVEGWVLSRTEVAACLLAAEGG